MYPVTCGWICAVVKPSRVARKSRTSGTFRVSTSATRTVGTGAAGGDGGFLHAASAPSTASVTPSFVATTASRRGYSAGDEGNKIGRTALLQGERVGRKARRRGRDAEQVASVEAALDLGLAQADRSRGHVQVGQA